MRILYLNHNVARHGGTFYRAYHVGRYLTRHGHSVTLLTISASKHRGFEREVSEGVEIIHTPDLLWGLGRSGWDPWDTVNRIAYLRDKQWNIIHAWDCRPVVILPALYARRQSHKISGKLVIDWADWWGRGGVQAERTNNFARAIYGPIETFFEEAFRTRADGTTVISQALRERALRLGVPEDPLLMLPQGCEPEAIQPFDHQTARTALGLPIGEFVVGYRGTLTIREVDLLMEALVLARKQIPNLRFLAGNVVVTSSAISFRQAADKYWGEWITETGWVPYEQLGLQLAVCNVFVLPMYLNSISNQAKWPSKINDFLSAGRPVVATRVKELTSLFRHEIGVLTDDDPASLAQGLIQIAQQPAQAEYYGRQARALAEGELNWTRVTEQLETFYVKVINS
jgi:glycosyltransferase involved in cell wall biosynthesis